MRKSTELVLVLAAGMVVGSALGLLFSPGKGSDTRKKVRDEAKRLMKSLHAQTRKGKLEMVKGKLEKYKSRIEKHLEKVNSRLNEQEMEQPV